MASTYSFDVVSEIDMQEVDNAINQTKKELTQRYDFKGVKWELELNDEEIKILAADEFKLNSIIEILKGKFVKRNLSPKCLDFKKIESATMGAVRQIAALVKGISKEKAKEINNDIKTSKIKVQAQIMEDKLRVSAKNKDDLQECISMLKAKDYGIALQFTNYR